MSNYNIVELHVLQELKLYYKNYNELHYKNYNCNVIHYNSCNIIIILTNLLIHYNSCNIIIILTNLYELHYKNYNCRITRIIIVELHDTRFLIKLFVNIKLWQNLPRIRLQVR